MSDRAPIRLKCPLCAADVVAQQGHAGQVITCDFCLEEFAIPAASIANPSSTVASDPVDEVPTGFTPAANSARADLSDEDEDALGFADELPGSPAPTRPGPSNMTPTAAPSESPDDEWLRVGADLTTPDEDHPGKKVVLTSDYEFSGPCPLCATRFVATDDQIGSTIQCPDCHTKFEIREPLPEARQPLRRGGGWDDDDELGFGEPADLATILTPTDDPLGSSGDVDSLDALDTDTALPRGNSVRPMPNAASWPRDAPGVEGNTILADAALRKAEAEIEAQEAEQSDLPPRPLTNGVLGCFADPSLLMRWVVMALGIQIELSALVGAIERAMIDGDAMAHFTSLMMGCFAGLFGIGLLLGGSVTLLAITQDTAVGRDRIENWPDANFMDWIVESFYVLCALFVCLVVGALAGQIFLPFGLVIYAWGLVFTIGLSTVIVFPVFLLATLETGLAVNPISGPIFRSLFLARASWIQFASISVGLAFVAVLGWLLRSVESTILNFVSSMMMSGALFVYFRLLGRLAWICQEAIADDNQRREEAPSDGG